MKVMKSLVIMASLVATCSSFAKEGDVEAKVRSKATGAEAILEVGQCRPSRQTDYNGNPYIQVEVQYVLCKQFETYTADVTDNGLWKSDTEANVRNRSYSTRTSIETTSSTYQPTKVSAGASALEQIGSIAIDSALVLSECNSQREALLMQARQNSAELVAQCAR